MVKVRVSTREGSAKCRGGSARPAPEWLLKWDREAGSSPAEPHCQELGQAAGFTLQPLIKRPRMTHSQKRKAAFVVWLVPISGPWGLVLLGHLGALAHQSSTF